MESLIPESAEQVLAACDRALGMAPAEFPPTLPGSKELLGAPEWHPFEHAVWPIGESIRRAFLKYPKLRREPDLLSRVSTVATCRNLRRGRQSFVMALGFVNARQYAPALAPFVNDPDVDGHIVDTLLKMKAPGFASSVAVLASSDKEWIRNLARKYIERYPG